MNIELEDLDVVLDTKSCCTGNLDFFKNCFFYSEIESRESITKIKKIIAIGGGFFITDRNKNYYLLFLLKKFYLLFLTLYVINVVTMMQRDSENIKMFI